MLMKRFEGRRESAVGDIGAPPVILSISGANMGSMPFPYPNKGAAGSKEGKGGEVCVGAVVDDGVGG